MLRGRLVETLQGRDVAWSGRHERASALKLLVVMDIPR